MIEPARRERIRRVRIVVPVFNDWDSLGILLRELNGVAGSLGVKMTVSAVDDGSTIPPGEKLSESGSLESIDKIEILHLKTNVGHQRAIAIGLCAAVEDDDFDAIVVMDADGEDSPQAIEAMFEAAENAAEFYVVARRGKRSENLTFRLSYLVYKLLFKLLTGRQIDFGNFCVMSRDYARRLASVSDLWNNFPAAVLRSKLPIKELAVDRAHRYAGESKMNLTSLVVHGLSGVSVYAETIFVRLLFLTGVLFALSIISAAVALSLHIFFPLYAAPGWATAVSLGVSILLLQSLGFILSAILILLNGRAQRLIVPIADYKAFIYVRQTLCSAVKHDR